MKTKRECVKDIIVVIILPLIVGMLLGYALMGQFGIGAVFSGYFFAAIPSGMKVIGKFLKWNLVGFSMAVFAFWWIKIILGAIIGMVAFPVYIIMTIINFAKAV